MQQRPIYLDHNATTPVDPRVVEEMLPYFQERFGNASSASHAYGWQADEAVKLAREQVAALFDAEPEEIVFTSGATEALTLALKGVAEAYEVKGRHIVVLQTEHRAVLDACAALQRGGIEVTLAPVDPEGLVDLDALEGALRPDTIIVSAIWANNETGTVQPVGEIADIVRGRGILFLTDATQAAGKIPVSVENVDLLACSAHKFYGPKGAGALYVRRRKPRVRLMPLQEGGGQERGLRGGTLNVPAIVGMGRAAELAIAEMDADAERLSALRDRLEASLFERVPDVSVNGSPRFRLPNTTNLRFNGIRVSDLMAGAREVAFSSASACSTAAGKPSHVLMAMGLSRDEAMSSARFGIGRRTTREEIDLAVHALASAAQRLRADQRTVSTIHTE